MSGKKIIDNFCKNLDPSLLNMLYREMKKKFRCTNQRKYK